MFRIIPYDSNCFVSLSIVIFCLWIVLLTLCSLCLLGGDFNFRVNLDRALIVDYSAQKNYQAILEHDQVATSNVTLTCRHRLLVD